MLLTYRFVKADLTDSKQTTTPTAPGAFAPKPLP